jgi:hypothetical protein
MSGSQGDSAKSKALRLGARDFLREPLDPQSFGDPIAGDFSWAPLKFAAYDAQKPERELRS